MKDTESKISDYDVKELSISYERRIDDMREDMKTQISSLKRIVLILEREASNLRELIEAYK